MHIIIPRAIKKEKKERKERKRKEEQGKRGREKQQICIVKNKLKRNSKKKLVIITKEAEKEEQKQKIEGIKKGNFKMVVVNLFISIITFTLKTVEKDIKSSSN